MPIPTEPIGSIPRPPELVEAMRQLASGRISTDMLRPLYEQATRDTIQRFEATGSPVITDGEQSKPSFVSYPIHGLETLAPDGVTIAFADGHVRQLPRLTAGPFRYRTRSEEHTSELQSQSNLVCRLLLEKKKNTIRYAFSTKYFSHPPSIYNCSGIYRCDHRRSPPPPTPRPPPHPPHPPHPPPPPSSPPP